MQRRAHSALEARTNREELWRNLKSRTVIRSEKGEVAAINRQNAGDVEPFRHSDDDAIHKIHATVGILFEYVCGAGEVGCSGLLYRQLASRDGAKKSDEDRCIQLSLHQVTQFWQNHVRQNRLQLFFQRQRRDSMQIVVAVQHGQEQAGIEKSGHTERPQPVRRSASRFRISSA